MTSRTFTLTVLPQRYAICQLYPGTPVPAWALSSAGFVSISRTPDELSLVCPEANVPAELGEDHVGRARRCLRIEGPFDLNVVGVLAAIAAPLAAAGIALFVVSTYDTDY